MNYSYEEAVKEFEKLLEGFNKLVPCSAYTLNCLWQVILKGSEHTQDQLNDAYDQGYIDGKKVLDHTQYDQGYDEGYSDAESTFGGKE